MEDRVILLCREGTPIPRYQLSMPQTEFVGAFSCGDEYDKDARRTMKVARLRTVMGDVLPPLWDAQHLQFKNGIGVYTGFEVANPLSNNRRSQTWKVKIAGWRPSMDPD